ncbi:carboxypeptidase-like regulatory domain-containing protein [Bremerella sp. JC770]|uniref:carboxypeptidase-like regulatory domain-containing protein n=1 Tax=Bremerella sp. JC770 TaxID=3232137 RepID=UPI00345B04C3
MMSRFHEFKRPPLNRRWTCTGLIIATLCVTAVGCQARSSRPPAEIQGVVRLDGKPLEQASVHFTSPRTGESAYANVEPGGTYRIPFPEVDIGELYEVAVRQPIVEVEYATDAPTSQPKTIHIPGKYANRRTSGLTFKIEAGGSQTFDIELSGS